MTGGADSDEYTAWHITRFHENTIVYTGVHYTPLAYGIRQLYSSKHNLMCQASPVVVYSSELATQGCGLDEDQAQHWLSIKKTQQRATTSQKCKCKCFKNKCHVSKTGHLLFFCKAENKGAAKQANYAD